jgi:hypothetical protein
MEILVSVLLFAAICYNTYQFVIFMKKRKEVILMPATDEDRVAIRKYPQSKENNQKENVTLYMLILAVITILFGLGFILSNKSDWAFYLMLLLLLFNSSNLLNGFAIMEEGLLTEGRFIPWKRIKEFHFVPIDINHKFYGYSKEVNHGYELKIKGKFFGTSCIVTTEEMKEKLTGILSKHIEVNSGKLPLNEQ